MTKLNTSASVSSFNLLARVLRPTALIHVGAGYGHGWLHQWRNWGVPAAWLIDADASKLGWINKLAGVELTVESPGKSPDAEPTQGNPIGINSYHAIYAVVGEVGGEGVFFQANNPEESALISPEELRSVWPNLRAVSKQTQPIETLDELITVPAGAWLVVDCLPALTVLKGAAQVLDNTQVVVARVLLNAASAKNEANLDGVGELGTDAASEAGSKGLGLYGSSSAQGVTEFLTDLGFTLADEVLGHHPGVGHLVFARPYSVADTKALSELLDLEKKSGQEVAAELNQKIQALIEQRDVAVKDKVTVQQQKDDLQKKLGEVESQFTSQLLAVKEDVANANKQRDELNHQLASLKNKLEEQLAAAQLDLINQAEQAKKAQAELVQQKDEAIKNLGEAQTKLAELSKEKEAGLSQRDALAKEKAALIVDKDALTKQLEDQKKAGAERQTKLDELSKSLQVEAQKVKDLNAKLEAANAEKIAAEQEKDSVAKQREDLAKRLAETEQQVVAATQEKANTAKQRDELIQQHSGMKELLEKAKQTEEGLVQQRGEAIKRLEEAEARFTALTEEKSAALKKSQEQATHTEKLAAEIAALKQSVEAANKDKEVFKQNTQKEHETAVQSLNTMHHEAVTKLQQQLDTVQKELEAAKKSVIQLQQQVKDLESVRAESNKLKAENDELHQRQLLMNEELVKAEGQITLIKDLLLREQGI